MSKKQGMGKAELKLAEEHARLADSADPEAAGIRKGIELAAKIMNESCKKPIFNVEQKSEAIQNKTGKKLFDIGCILQVCANAEHRDIKDILVVMIRKNRLGKFDGDIVINFEKEEDLAEALNILSDNLNNQISDTSLKTSVSLADPNYNEPDACVELADSDGEEDEDAEECDLGYKPRKIGGRK